MQREKFTCDYTFWLINVTVSKSNDGSPPASRDGWGIPSHLRPSVCLRPRCPWPPGGSSPAALHNTSPVPRQTFSAAWAVAKWQSTVSGRNQGNGTKPKEIRLLFFPTHLQCFSMIIYASRVLLRFVGFYLSRESTGCCRWNLGCVSLALPCT